VVEVDCLTGDHEVNIQDVSSRCFFVYIRLYDLRAVHIKQVFVDIFLFLLSSSLSFYPAIRF